MDRRYRVRQDLFLLFSLAVCLGACSFFDTDIPQASATALPPTTTVTIVPSGTPTLLPSPKPETGIPTTPTSSPTPAVLEPACQDQVFSPQGTWFFCREDQPEPRIISMVSTDGKACSNLEINSETGPIRFFTLSPTGLHLALALDNLEGQFPEQIWIVQLPQLVVLKKIDLLSAETREMIASYRLTEESFDPFDFSHPIQSALQWNTDRLMMWSPDGHFLAYAGAAEGTSVDVYVYNTENNQTAHLTSGPSQAVLYGWSPDSEWIVHQEAVKFTEYGTLYDQAWAVSAVTGQVVDLGGSFGQRIIGWISEDTFLVESYGGFEHPLDEIDLINIQEASRQSIPIVPSDDEIFDSEHGVLLLESSIWGEIERGIFVQLPITAAPVRILTGDYYLGAYHPELDLFSASDPEDNLILFTPSGEIKLKLPGAFEVYPSPDGQVILLDRFALINRAGDMLVNLEGSRSTAWAQDFTALVAEYKNTFYLLSQSNSWEPQAMLRLPGSMSCIYLESQKP